MESLFKKLEQISDLLKQYQTSMKMPKLPGMPTIKVPSQKMPGITPPSKKDPIKMAQQLKNADTKPLKPKTGAVQFSKLGQWSLK